MREVRKHRGSTEGLHAACAVPRWEMDRRDLRIHWSAAEYSSSTRMFLEPMALDKGQSDTTLDRRGHPSRADAGVCVAMSWRGEGACVWRRLPMPNTRVPADTPWGVNSCQPLLGLLSLHRPWRERDFTTVRRRLWQPGMGTPAPSRYLPQAAVGEGHKPHQRAVNGSCPSHSIHQSSPLLFPCISCAKIPDFFFNSLSAVVGIRFNRSQLCRGGGWLGVVSNGDVRRSVGSQLGDKSLHWKLRMLGCVLGFVVLFCFVFFFPLHLPLCRRKGMKEMSCAESHFHARPRKGLRLGVGYSLCAGKFKMLRFANA
ncbi:uncharacterized protein LOC141733457 [Larus michahellis]|uniref:uncharacterized protein LOC141733457 n=1 Tax=Larus michahellis TaxID=119627 RepID=UPI003D9B1D3A